MLYLGDFLHQLFTESLIKFYDFTFTCKFGIIRLSSYVDYIHTELFKLFYHAV